MDALGKFIMAVHICNPTGFRNVNLVPQEQELHQRNCTKLPAR